jgi:hypothetical protein
LLERKFYFHLHNLSVPPVKQGLILTQQDNLGFSSHLSSKGHSKAWTMKLFLFESSKVQSLKVDETLLLPGTKPGAWGAASESGMKTCNNKARRLILDFREDRKWFNVKR